MSDPATEPTESIAGLLARIKAETPPADEHEPLAEQEANRFNQSGAEEHAKLDRDLKELRNKSLSQDISERKNYAGKIFLLVCIWLGLVLLIVTYSGWDLYRVHVSDSVLIALITGVSVNVIALFAIVAKYLFPKR